MSGTKTNHKIDSVTIVTPSYNQGSYIEETIKSIWSQTGNIRVEHIIADGGSTDSTLQIIKKYDKLYRSKKYPFKCREFVFRWWSKKDNGQTDAIIQGFNQATSDVLNWINSDDILLDNNSLETIIKSFNDGKADIIVGKGRLIDEKSNNIGEGSLLSTISNNDNFQRILPTIKKGDFLFQQSVFFRKTVLNECPLNQSLRYCMDWDLYLKFYQAKKTFRFINYYVGALREQPEAKTQIMPLGVYKKRLDLYRFYHIWCAGRFHCSLKILFLKIRPLNKLVDIMSLVVASCLPFYNNRKLNKK